jgi:cytochrome c1
MVALLLAVAAIGSEVSGDNARTLAMTLTRGNPDNAPPLLRRYGCAGCHTIDALTGAEGQVGPPLQHLRQRTYIGGRLQNTPDNLIQWIVAPQRLDPGCAMPDTGITEAEARDVAAFLYAN